MVLNNQMLARLRQMTAQYLKDTCTIERQTVAYGQYNEIIADQWETVATDVACRVITEAIRRTSGELVGEQETLVETYRVVVPTGTGLAPNQRITVGGLVYEVVRLVTNRTDETDEQAVITRARID